jgi:hypothetical protein
MVGHPLGVVAGRHRDDAPDAVLRQVDQFVAGAALLEGGSELQVLELEENLRPHDFGKRP